MKALIIDDEPHCRNVIYKMVQLHCPQIKTIAEAATVATAIDQINNQQPDIVFLDIQLGDLTAFDLLHQLDEIDFQIIFTTAYDNFAIKAFEFSAVHYLLKPVAPSDIIEGVRRCANNELSYKKQVLEQARGFYLRTHENSYDIIYNQIKYIVADGSYSTIHNVKRQSIFTSKKLADYNELLTSDFYRIHHSIIVNMNFVEKIDKKGMQVILTDTTTLPLSRRRRTEFKKEFLKFSSKKSIE